MKELLSLSEKEARKFFLKKESYCNFELPDYFTFEKVINLVDLKITGKDIKSFFNSDKELYPEKMDGVNYKLLSNKDGKYAWRPLQLIHPVLYVHLVDVITDRENWKYIKERLLKLMRGSKTIKCASMPVIATYFKKDKAEQITQWISGVERESVILGLDYDYLYHTDIVDCYGSIYTHVIPWSLHDKEFAKKNKKDYGLVGNKIDRILCWMSYGQTNGIPQGSVLMDFIAEIVLCYVDSLLYKKIEGLKNNEYRIIRYRDDYRIFTNYPSIAEKIIKELTDILNGFGMKVNSSKTKNSDNIIHSAIKSDKLELMCNPRIFENFTSELYFISRFSLDFPNSGQLLVLMKNIFDKLDQFNDKKIKKENLLSLISIVVDIAYKNPRTYSISSAIISRLIIYLPKKKREDCIRKILDKFNKLPNTGIMQIWLQRITLKLNKGYNYMELLCDRVIDSNVLIWNSNWLSFKFRNEINSCSIVDKNIINSMKPTISKKETDLFEIREYPL